jgi:hypothetical protein
VGIENNTDRNFKDLEEMLGSAKELKRNNQKLGCRADSQRIASMAARLSR